MTKHLEIILKKMCQMVGANFDEVDFKEQGWYQKYSWTKKQQGEFQTWFINYIVSHKEARQEIMQYPNLLTRQNLYKVWAEFNLAYGWVVKDEK